MFGRVLEDGLGCGRVSGSSAGCCGGRTAYGLTGGHAGQGAMASEGCRAAVECSLDATTRLFSRRFVGDAETQAVGSARRGVVDDANAPGATGQRRAQRLSWLCMLGRQSDGRLQAILVCGRPMAGVAGAAPSHGRCSKRAAQSVCLCCAGQAEAVCVCVCMCRVRVQSRRALTTQQYLGQRQKGPFSSAPSCPPSPCGIRDAKSNAHAQAATRQVLAALHRRQQPAPG